MSRRRGRLRSNLRPVTAWAVLIVVLACGVSAYAQVPGRAPEAAAASGPAWLALTASQQSALAPLKKDWPAIDAPRKQKWLEIAARFPSMPKEEQQRIQERMAEWTRMSPEERGRARLQFQEARQIDPRERQARWDAYLALPADERRALSKSASTVPKAGAVSIRNPAGEPPPPPKAATPQPNGVASPSSTQSAAKTAAPAVVQAKPGASTTLISKTASPPVHAQGGRPKIAADEGKIDRSTLLPQTGPQRTTAPASAPQ
jgi:hypothetical protein